MYATSTIPSPPGVIGTAVSNRANANTPSTCAQLTSASDTPTNRSASTSTRYSERWLMIVVLVSQSQRSTRKSIVFRRNRTAASPQSNVRERRSSLATHVAARPSPDPIALANRFFHITRPNSTTAPIRMRTPTIEAPISDPLARCVTMIKIRAIAGSASFAKMFRTEVTATERPTSVFEKPQARYIS
jgi:hypothetical protein